MSKRPNFRTPAFGEWVRLKREERGWSHAQLTNRLRHEIAEATGLTVDRSASAKLQRGKVPNWAELAGLCRIFSVPFEDTLRSLAFTVEVAGRDGRLMQTLGIHGEPGFTEVRRKAPPSELKSDDGKTLETDPGALQSETRLAPGLLSHRDHAAEMSGGPLSRDRDSSLDSVATDLRKTAADYRDGLQSITLLAKTLGDALASVLKHRDTG